MKCTKCKDLLDDYIRGWLDQQLTGEITDHLAICDSCAADYESHKSLLSVLESEPVLVIEKEELVDFVPGVWQKIEKQKRIPVTGWLFKLVPSLMVAAMLSFFILKPPVYNTPGVVENLDEDEIYSETGYNALLSMIFSDEESEVLDLIENELYANGYIFSDESYRQYFEGLDEEGYKLLENKLNELLDTAG